MYIKKFRGVSAGLVEYATLNLRVVSSSPTLGMEPTLKNSIYIEINIYYYTIYGNIIYIYKEIRSQINDLTLHFSD